KPASNSHPNQSSSVAWYAEVANSYSQPFQAYFNGPRSKYRSIQSHCFAPDSSFAHVRNGVSLHGCAIEATSLPCGTSTSWIELSTFGMSGMSCSARQEVTISKDSTSRYLRS